jgi:hypothetical protein
VANRLLTRAVGRMAQRVPLLRQLPVMRLIMLGEILVLAREHFERLTPRERRRLVVLLRDGRGRPRAHLSPRERGELEALVAKADPKLFATTAAQRLSPVPIPHRNRSRA